MSAHPSDWLGSSGDQRNGRVIAALGFLLAAVIFFAGIVHAVGGHMRAAEWPAAAGDRGALVVHVDTGVTR